MKREIQEEAEIKWRITKNKLFVLFRSPPLLFKPLPVRRILLRQFTFDSSHLPVRMHVSVRRCAVRDGGRWMRIQPMQYACATVHRPLGQLWMRLPFRIHRCLVRNRYNILFYNFLKPFIPTYHENVKIIPFKYIIYRVGPTTRTFPPWQYYRPPDSLPTCHWQSIHGNCFSYHEVPLPVHPIYTCNRQLSTEIH